jgi:adenylylsulfate kinase-like enzyme
MSVIILSGPIGAGKTTVAKELISLLPPPLTYIEGDTFWSFIAKKDNRDRREVFGVIMRSMAAAAVPFSRSGYSVLLDFSVPPHFVDTARKILKEVPLHYVVLKPSLATCEARASNRIEGKIANYDQGFYDLFEGAKPRVVSDDKADAQTLAKMIEEDIKSGKFSVP